MKLYYYYYWWGKRRNYSFTNIVKSDITHIRTKERVLTDLKIFIIDNPLTGESIAVTATKECDEKYRKDTLEATNLVFLFELFSFVGVCASIGEFITSASEDYVPITQNNNKYKKILQK